MLQFLGNCTIPSSSRAWKRGDLLTLLVEIHRLLVKDGLELDPEEVSRRLNAFYQRIESREELPPDGEDRRDLEAYFRAALQANQDKGNRVRRGEILRKVLTS